MKNINILDSNTIDKIAAGEVVERPSAVVKELVENSIDANADAVTIEIKDGGISFIRITDNGEGIDRSQVKKAIPPSFISIVTASALASIEFSTSSFTTADGLSTTSPAAILSIVFESRIFIFFIYQIFHLLFSLLCRLLNVFIASIGVSELMSNVFISFNISSSVSVSNKDI